MADELNTELLAKLDMLIKLQALSMVGRFESSKEKILFLSRVGMQPKEISELLQTSPNTVSVTLSKSRKLGV
jgi:DNA-binding NarL/FixJ family response regulator